MDNKNIVPEKKILKWRKLKKTKSFHTSVSTNPNNKISTGLRAVSTRKGAYNIGTLFISTNTDKKLINWERKSEDYDY